MEGLADRLTRVLSDVDLRARMGEGSLRIAATHGIEKTLDAFEEIYELVTSSRSGEATRVDTPAPAGVRGGADPVDAEGGTA